MYQTHAAATMPGCAAPMQLWWSHWPWDWMWCKPACQHCRVQVPESRMIAAAGTIILMTSVPSRLGLTHKHTQPTPATQHAASVHSIHSLQITE